MYRKVFVGGLVVIACVCVLAVKVVSQEPYRLTLRLTDGKESKTKVAEVTTSSSAVASNGASLEALLQRLEKMNLHKENVQREYQQELNKIEKERKALVVQIQVKIKEQREQLDRLQQRLQRIGGVPIPEVTSGAATSTSVR